MWQELDHFVGLLLKNNNEFKLIYKGAIDDNVKSKSSVKSNWVKDAVISTGKNEPISLAETRNSGCSIKRL